MDVVHLCSHKTFSRLDESSSTFLLISSFSGHTELHNSANAADSGVHLNPETFPSILKDLK